jgi:predicted RNA binding protein YcfA (HicA-like mRNA interferase family)
MGKKEKLYKKAKSSPTNLRFSELCSLAENVGFAFRDQTGSHKIYKHTKYDRTMNFQPDKHDKSKAKKFQIRQLIDFIDEHKLIKGEEDV